MPESDSETLKEELLLLDIQLRRKQVSWESPRNIAILAGAMAAIFGATAGFLGYQIGRTPPPPIVIQLQEHAR